MTCSIDPGAALRSKAVSSQGAILASEQSAAQHSVRPTRGILRDLQEFFWLRVYTALKPNLVPPNCR